MTCLAASSAAVGTRDAAGECQSRCAVRPSRAQARTAVQSASGVNLDEEAADLVRWQQAYQAAAQTIVVAKTMFDTLIDAVRR